MASNGTVLRLVDGSEPNPIARWTAPEEIAYPASYILREPGGEMICRLTLAENRVLPETHLMLLRQIEHALLACLSSPKAPPARPDAFLGPEAV